MLAAAEVAALRGWYSASDAAQLVGVSGRKLGQWVAHGYLTATRDPGPPPVLSYLDVAEGLAVHELLRRGVPRREIRHTVANCREQYGAWPLQTAPVRFTQMTPKRARLALEEGEQLYDISHAKGQQTELRWEDLQALASLLRRGGWVLRDNDQITHIEVDPEKLSGKPSILGRRLAAADVAVIAMSPNGHNILLDDYELAPVEIKDAVDWWRLVSEVAAAA